MSFPLITVIVPIRNEKAYIARCLDSLLAQDFPVSHLEVLVVDGCSEDGTRELVQEYTQRCDWIQLIDNPEQTAPYALNYGLAVARGDILVRVDGHCELAPDYLTTAVRLLDETQAACVGGPLTSVGEGWRAQAIAMAMSTPFGVGNALFRYADKPAYVDTVAFGAYRRDVFDQIGTFNPALTRNQDDEFNWRLRAAGFRIYLSPELKAVYYTRSTYRQLWKQYFQYGFWKIRVIRDHPGSVQPRHLAPAAFVLALGAGLSASVFHRRGKFLLAAVAAPYLVGALGFGLKRSAASPRYLPGVLAAFPVLHLAYGLGFLSGILALLTGKERRQP